MTDYEGATIWRVPPKGGTPERWLKDPALDGGPFGLTGIRLAADRKTFVVAMQSQAGLGAGVPSNGRIVKIPILADGKPGPIAPFWESRPLDGPDGFGIAQSGAIYISLLLANQIAVVGADGTETGRAELAALRLAFERGLPRHPDDGRQPVVRDGQRRHPGDPRRRGRRARARRVHPA